MRSACVGLALLASGVGACTDAAAPDPPGVPEVPRLVGLTTVGAQGLNPDFSPETARYSIVATQADGEDLEFTATFDEGLSATIDGSPLMSGEAFTDLFEPGTSIEIVLTNAAGDDQTYEIVYLPFDFPELFVTVSRDGPDSGVTYLTIGTWLVVVDDHGVPVFYRREAGRVFDFKRHVSGERSYAVRTGARNEFDQWPHEIVILGDDFEIADRVTTIGLNQPELHEFLIRENGNYVLLSYHGEIQDMTPVGRQPDELVIESVVQEMTRGRTIAFQWTSWGSIPTTEALRDWPDYAHVNSIFVDDAGDYIVSARGVSQILKVDGDTGDVLWKLGGMSNQFTFVNDPYSHLCGQHTATLLPNGSLLAFDNGQLCWPEDPARGS